jgi:hypothetical protein
VLGGGDEKKLVVLAMTYLPDRIYGAALAALRIYGLVTRQSFSYVRGLPTRFFTRL